ncbi:MAG TPA: DUF362 domain-containing protein [Thermodesulfobacteriota bacterium]|nr:DUF362 domain-containing protein [Thermodesulfobacteriota bacterium]
MKEEKATVYFADLRADTKRNLLDKLSMLLEMTGISGRFKKGHLVAVKMHFGERGNTAYIPPVFVRRVVARIKETGARPFLTDTNTLYVGTRGNSVQHLETAVENGFAYSVVAAPVIIADGLRGMDGVAVSVDGRHFGEVSIAREIASANGLVVLTHFKCHEMTGFGGALKNLGMGCASREGKLAQHSNCAPVVNPAGCTGCGECVLVCPVDAIDMGAVAVIREKACIGCGHCIGACPEGVINVQWNEGTSILQEKMAEHAKGALKGKAGMCAYVNFITQVSPECDCYGHTDAPIVPDIGLLASTDPVAIDQASVDLVNGAEGFRGNTALKSGFEPGGDKFRGVYAEVDWEVQLRRAEELGIGKRAYSLVMA